MKSLIALLACVGILGGCGRDEPGNGAGSAATEKVKDPVCGMMIDKSYAKGHQEHRGGHYYFCSEDCATKFKDSPDTYVK